MAELVAYEPDIKARPTVTEVVTTDYGCPAQKGHVSLRLSIEEAEDLLELTATLRDYKNFGNGTIDNVFLALNKVHREGVIKRTHAVRDRKAERGPWLLGPM